MATHTFERRMNRQEFSKRLRRAIIQRAMIAGVPTCEWVDDAGVRCVCTKGLEIAHIELDALRSAGAKQAKPLTAEDGRLLCKPHHTAFDAASKTDLAKAIRVQDRATGAAKPKKGFARVSKEKPQLRVANGVPGLMRRGFVAWSESDG